MSESQYENVELPGTGEIRARKGTSTLELAGAAKYWFDKSKTSWIEGFSTGSFVGAAIALAVSFAYHYIRSH